MPSFALPIGITGFRASCTDYRCACLSALTKPDTWHYGLSHEHLLRHTDCILRYRIWNGTTKTIRGLIPDGGKTLLCSLQRSVGVVEPNKPPIQWVSWSWRQEQSGQNVELNPYRHLVQRLRINGAILLLPHTPSWHAQR
jgi:hypothetical protein